MQYWYYGAYGLPQYVPRKWGIEAVEAYMQYLREREDDLLRGLEPSTDEVDPWSKFLEEYLHAELEAASGGPC